MNNCLSERRVGIVLLMLVISFSPLYARLGETEIQCADRYGTAKTDDVSKITDKMSPLIEGGITHTYNYQGWVLCIAPDQYTIAHTNDLM